MLKHKGYTGEYKFSVHDNVFHGIVTNIEDLVSFEADTEGEIEQAFEHAIDDYIETLKDIGKLHISPIDKIEGQIRVSNDFKDQAIKDLNDCVGGDPEDSHSEADNILCNLLISLGYIEVVEAYNKIQPKYYS